MRSLRVGDRVRGGKPPYVPREEVGTVVEVRPPSCHLPNGLVVVAWDNPELGEWVCSQAVVTLLPEDFGSGAMDWAEAP